MKKRMRKGEQTLRMSGQKDFFNLVTVDLDRELQEGTNVSTARTSKHRPAKSSKGPECIMLLELYF